MSDLDIFSVVSEPINVFSVYLNTGTLLDLICGNVFRTNTHLVVNGGMSNIFGIGGRSQTYKSSVMDSFIARTMSIYKNVKCIVFDSENSKPGTDRYNDLAINDEIISDRIRLYDTTTDDLNSFHDKIKAIVEYKKKNMKHMLVETPFIDNTTGKPLMMPVPTIVEIDSFTLAGVDSETESIDHAKSGLEDSALNTIWMKSGKNKTLFMRQLVQYARSANIYFVLTAHVGDNKDLGGNPYLPVPKQLQYMGQNDKLKNVGAQFIFLTNTFLQTKNVNTLVSDDKECLYPGEFNNSNELNKVSVMVARNKINASGHLLPFVISQYEGLMNVVTHVQYLKDMKAESLLERKNATMKCALYPEKTFTRKTIRTLSKADSRLERAIEIAAQFIFVKNFYTTKIVDLSLPVEKLVDVLLSNDKNIIYDVLDSRGYWTYSHDDREYLSIFDIIDRVNTVIKKGTHTSIGTSKSITATHTDTVKKTT